MQYEPPLIHGILERRYKRFLADVRLDTGERITVHCANSGRMTTCNEPGRPVALSDAQNPRRKLRYTWEMIHMGDAWVGVHSALSNRIIAEAVAAGRIAELPPGPTLRREVAYGEGRRSRVDLVLEPAEGPPCYVEVKHSTLRVGDHAAFPDAVSTRGQKHIEDLMHVAQDGARAVLVFAVGRADCHRFRPADEIDPDYGALLRQATGKGVEVLAYRLRFDPAGVTVEDRLPVDWDVRPPAAA